MRKVALHQFPGSVWIALGFLALFVGSSSRPGYGDPQRSDSWEVPPPTGLRDCEDIEDALIVPVPAAHRSEVIAKLKNVSVVELSAHEASAVLDLAPAPDRNAFGTSWILEAINKLKDRRQATFEGRNGSWSNADQQHLDRLQTIASEPSLARLRPFLVRAVGKNEGTGGFFGSTCGDSLVIVHGSLGHSTPSSTRLPVVILLERAPLTVYVDWKVAR